MLPFSHTFKRDIISDMNHSQSFFTDANFQLQVRSRVHDKTKIDPCVSLRTNVKCLRRFVFSCRGISFSDPLSGNVRVGVEN